MAAAVVQASAGHVAVLAELGRALGDIDTLSGEGEITAAHLGAAHGHTPVLRYLMSAEGTSTPTQEVRAGQKPLKGHPVLLQQSLCCAAASLSS